MPPAHLPVDGVAGGSDRLQTGAVTRSWWFRLSRVQRAGLLAAAVALPFYGVATAIGAFADEARPTVATTASPASPASPAPAASRTTGQKPVPPSGGCHPYYQPCVPLVSDVDCKGGGDGPVFVTGPIRVTGEDPYRLDPDGDGVACA
jgi:hypothetical protein